MTRDFVQPHGRAEDDDNALPDDELDRDREVGAGVMGTGGAAIDRRTGTLGGRAEGSSSEREDDPLAEVLDLGDDPNAGPERRIESEKATTLAPRWEPNADES